MANLTATRGAPATSEIRNNLDLNILGASQREEIQSILNRIDTTVGDAYARQSVIFHSDSALLFEGTEVQNTDSTIEIRVTQTHTGAIHLYEIPQGINLPVANDGDFIYAIVARDGSGTGNTPSNQLTFSNGNLIAGSSSLPPLSNSTLFYLPILMRIDGEFKKYVHWFFGHGVWAEGSQAQVGLAGTADDPATTANLMSMRAERRWHASVYEWFTDNIIARYLDSRIDDVNFPFSAVLDDTQRGFDFPAVGNELTTIDMMDPSYKSQQFAGDIFSVEVQAFYSLEEPDLNPQIEVARDGQTFYQIEVNRNKDTDLFYGTYYFEGGEPLSTVHSQTTENTTLDLDNGSQRFISQQIIDTSQFYFSDKVELLMQSQGSPQGAVRVVIAEDNGAGQPVTDKNGTVILSDWVQASTIGATQSWVEFKLNNTISSRDLHMYLEATADYYDNYSGADKVSVAADAASSEFQAQVSNDASTWSTLNNTTLAYQFNGRIIDLRVKVTSSQPNVNFLGLTLSYGSQVNIETGFLHQNIFKISSTPVGPLTLDFIPDNRALQAYVHETGQVFRYPFFDIDGKDVTFPAGFFDDEAPLTVEFIQQLGYSFDNSDRNAALLRENKLGSTDLDIDLSKTGEGIKLRADDGVLVEAYLTWNGSAYEWAFNPLP